MARRQRSRAPAQAALIALLGLVAATAGCAPEVEGAPAPDRSEPGLQPVETPVLLAPPPTVPEAPEPDPELVRRGERLTAAFRAKIARWTEEARKQSKGKADAGNVHVSVAVRELGSRHDLVLLRADEVRRPASNLKLVTTAAALVLLGRGATWVTPVEAVGAIRDGTLEGDLVVRAGGDPLCDPEGQGRVEERLDALAQQLHEGGLRRVIGALVLDEGTFADPAPGPAWPDPSQRWAEYCALSGGFSANGGVLHALVRAGRPGGEASIEVHPSPHGLKSDYGVRTEAGTAVDVRVGATATTATVRGRIGQGLGQYEAEFAHPDPVRHFGELLRAALRSAGIAVDGELRRERGVAHGVRLAELRSPLADCLAPINAESRNGIADQVFLSLGASVCGAGTREAGARAVAMALERLGVPASSIVQVDGSGLSRDNRVSARAIVALLERVLGADPETARLYRDSLAVAGQTGTLEDRLGGTHAEGRVHAKTGWIAGVSALSGLAEPEDGRPVVFSILVEYPSALSGLNSGVFKKLQDELVLELFEGDP